MKADGMTKALEPTKHEAFVRDLGLRRMDDGLEASVDEEILGLSRRY